MGLLLAAGAAVEVEWSNGKILGWVATWPKGQSVLGQASEQFNNLLSRINLRMENIETRIKLGNIFIVVLMKIIHHKV